MHGPAGPLDIPLPLTGTPGLEPRSGGITQLVLTFDQPVQPADALPDTEVAVSPGNVTSITWSGAQVTANVAGLADGCVTITVTGWENAVTGTPQSAPMSFTAQALLGNTNGDKVVTLSDAVLVKSRIGQPLTSATAVYDLNLSGAIDNNDVQLAKSQITHTVSCP